jgi:CDP-glycerol glycerophosphotransferase (TagB/SpsB family)
MKIYQIGLPHYDVYKKPKEFLEEKNSFYKRLNLDTNKKLLSYGAMGDYLFKHEGRVADELETIISNRSIKQPIQVLFRAHPRFDSPLQRMKNMKNVIPDLGAKKIGKDIPGSEIDQVDTFHMINTLYYSDIVITGASTMAIDAIALGRPVICVAYDLGLSEKEIGYWYSVKRFYDTYTHFEALIQTGGVKVARSKEELAKYINAYLNDPKLDDNNRNILLHKFASPFDGKSGERLANILTEEIS